MKTTAAHIPLLNDRRLRAVKEAVRNVFWTREEIRKLFERCGVPQLLISEVRPDVKTWTIVDVVLDALNANEIYHHTLQKIIEQTLQYKDGKHLQWAGKEKVEAATASLTALREEIGELAEERRKRQRDEAERQTRIDKTANDKLFKEKLAELNTRFLSWFSATDPQARGIQFEAILAELFDLFDLAPKHSFRRNGEQIDGGFKLDNENYLLEAKWQAEPVNLNDLRDLDGAVNSTIETTLGLFVSVTGFSPTSLENLVAGNRPKLICMDGADLALVLDSRIDFSVLLRRKKEIAAQRRIVFVPASDIINGKY
jgi:hypothetical protein